MNKYKNRIKEIKRLGLMLILSVILTTGLVLSQDTSASPEKEYQQLFYQAKKLVIAKDWPQAIQAFKHIAKKFPGSEGEAQALYWTAYSLNKYNPDQQTSRELKEEAILLLSDLVQRFPASQWNDDAKRLTVEIAEDLAARGYNKYEKYLQRQAQKEGDDDIKIAAVDALMTMDKEKAFPLLEKLLYSNKNPDIRKKALFCLGQHKDSKVTGILIHVATKDPDPEVRKQAVFWLSQVHSPESLKQLINIYHSTLPSDIDMKKNLLLGFSLAGPEEGTDVLISIYKQEKNLELKKEILFLLGQSNSPKAQEFILKILE